MTSKHTPGPWRIHSGYIESDTGYEVCQVRTNHPCNADTQAANARLIAAAPGLREALRELTDDVADRFDLDSPSTNPGIKSTVAAARAAIAKATGDAD